MIKCELKARTGFLIRDIIHLLGIEGSDAQDGCFVLERAIELQDDMEKRWYHKFMRWRKDEKRDLGEVLLKMPQEGIKILVEQG